MKNIKEILVNLKSAIPNVPSPISHWASGLEQGGPEARTEGW
jgi:hypothetical protein